MRGKPVSARIEEGELTEAEAVELARESLLRTLAAAPKSRAELAASLARKGFPEGAANQALDRLNAVGLIDDANYAETLVRTRHAERGLARRAIAIELRRRGIEDADASSALAQVSAEDEEHSALLVATKALARTKGQSKDARVRRAAGALARKGYSQSAAHSAIKAVLATEGEEIEEFDG